MVLAALVVVGVWLQVYLIAAHLFGAGDALDLHESLGEIMRGLGVLVFLAALGAWWRNWGKIGHAFGLAAVVMIQIALTGGERWVGGLHGLLALVVLVMALFVAKDDADELGLKRASRGGDAGNATPRQLP